MEKNKFDAILHIIISALANKIMNEYNLTEDEAILTLYKTELYSMLEKEETKVWQYSNEMLFSLYSRELDTGILDLPEY